MNNNIGNVGENANEKNEFLDTQLYAQNKNFTESVLGSDGNMTEKTESIGDVIGGGVGDKNADNIGDSISEKVRAKPLRGTRTEKNLMTAASDEAQAQTKYELYSSAAYEEGLATVGDILWDLAHQEREHAEIWYDYLDKIGDTNKNLQAAMSSESYEAEAMYPEFARIASEEGFDEIAEKFALVGGIEANHKDILKNTLTELNDGTLYGKAPDNARWFCTNCGYVHVGSDAPERCPVCEYGKGYFLRYDN